MRYRIVVPAEPTDVIARGAAVIAAGPGRLAVYADPRVTFGERCARAIRQGRIVPAVQAAGAGWFDDVEGEATLERAGAAALERWLGQRVYLNDLRAANNRTDRRHRARRLAMQGRLAEAFEIDRHLGL